MSLLLGTGSTGHFTLSLFTETLFHFQKICYPSNLNHSKSGLPPTVQMEELLNSILPRIIMMNYVMYNEFTLP